MLEFTLAPSDLVAYAAYRGGSAEGARARLTRTRLLQAGLAGVGAYLLIAVPVTIPMLLARDYPAALGTFTFALLAGAGVGVWRWRQGLAAATRRLHRRWLAEASTSLARTGAERRMWLGDSGLHVAAGSREEVVAYLEVARIDFTGAQWVIHTTAGAAHLVPELVPGGAEFIAELRTRIG